MTISVTSEEFLQPRTTFVNGRPVYTEEITRIYVIEPLGHVDARQTNYTWFVIAACLVWLAILWL